MLARLVLQISYLSQLRHRIVPGRTLGLGAPVLAEDREPVDVFVHISKGFVYLFVRLLWAKKCSFTTFSPVFSASQIYELEVAFLRAVSDLTSEPRTTTSELFGIGGKLHSYFEETIELNGIQCACLCNDASLTFTPVLQRSRKRTCLCVTALVYVNTIVPWIFEGHNDIAENDFEGQDITPLTFKKSRSLIFSQPAWAQRPKA